jgi:hypothetical protein
MAGIIGNRPSYLERGTGLLSQAASTRSMMQKKQHYPEPEKTVGGGLLSGASMAAAGAQVGTAVSPGMGTLVGGLGGAIVGLGAYLLS